MLEPLAVCAANARWRPPALRRHATWLHELARRQVRRSDGPRPDGRTVGCLLACCCSRRLIRRSNCRLATQSVTPARQDGNDRLYADAGDGTAIILGRSCGAACLLVRGHFEGERVGTPSPLLKTAWTRGNGVQIVKVCKNALLAVLRIVFWPKGTRLHDFAYTRENART